MVHLIPAMRVGAHSVRVAPNVVRKSDAGAAPASPSPAVSPGAGSSGDPAADFRALFTSRSNPPTPYTPPPPPPSNLAPTAQSLFGANPWMSNPGGQAPNGVTYGYNPYYFATAETAAKVAQMVGGTVVQENALTPAGPFQQNMPNYMVKLPNGREIYAGMFASFFDHGYTQDFVNRLITSELNDTAA
jgi:hypothetical protein